MKQKLYKIQVENNKNPITELLHIIESNMQMMRKKDIEKYSIHTEVFGMIQGVGFRPFIATLANVLNINGFVYNEDANAIIILNISTHKNTVESILIFYTALLLVCKSTGTNIKKQYISIIQKANKVLLELHIPKQAFISSLHIMLNIDKTHKQGFHILESKKTMKYAIQAHIPLDTKICESCLKDMKNKDSRFYNYPFVACINCGARYSILKCLPYDRKNTSMKNIKLCLDCIKDYKNLSNRRFHTEPISCNKCAIRVEFYLYGQNEKHYNLNALKALANVLIENNVVLFKGLGGFAYIANARNKEVLQKIRNIKNREHKPFVVMANMPTLRTISLLTPQLESLLTSKEAPIVITPKHPQYNLSKEVSKLQTIGVMIPYTAMLMMLFSYLPTDFALIYTSANNKGEMIATTLHNLELNKIIKHTNLLYILDYKREIINCVDDSILLGIDLIKSSKHIKNYKHNNNHKNEVYLENNKNLDSNPNSVSVFNMQNTIQSTLYSLTLKKENTTCNTQINSHCINARAMRLSRGFTPLHLTSNIFKLKSLCAAFGAMQKSSLSFGFHNHIVVSPYMSDLFTPYNIANFRKTLDYFSKIYGTPQAIIADKHNQYISTQIAKEIAKDSKIPLFQVAHHHAHFNALLLESNMKEGIGVIFDGSGLGSDGTLWGGEFLYGDSKKVERILHFKPFKILGGEKHIKNCKRLAYSYALHNNITSLKAFIESSYNENEYKTLQALHKIDFNSPLCSSVGRLFDIAGFILGLEKLSYEAQSGELIASDAIKLAYNIIAHKKQTMDYNSLIQTFLNMPYNPYPFYIKQNMIDVSECIEMMFRDKQTGGNSNMIALRFIDTIAYCVLESLKLINTNYVLFGGGVFANYALCIRLKTLLKTHKIKAFFPKLPCNDYSISIGQLIYLQHLI